MAKIERTAKGKKKNIIATVFIIILIGVLFLEGIALGVIWIPEVIKRTKAEAYVAVLAKENPGREAAGEASAVVVEEYVYASMLDEKLIRFGEPTAENFAEYRALYEETAHAWERVRESSSSLYGIGDILEREEKKEGYSGVYGSSRIEGRNNKKRIANIFANKITEAYDKMSKGEKVKLLANAIYNDANNACEKYSAASETFELAESDFEAWTAEGLEACKQAPLTGKTCEVEASELLTGDAKAVTGSIGFSESSLGVTVCIDKNGNTKIVLGEDLALAEEYAKDAQFLGVIKPVTSNEWIPKYETDETLVFLEDFDDEETEGVRLAKSLAFDFDGSVKVVIVPIFTEDQTDPTAVMKDIEKSLSAGAKNLKNAKVAVSDSDEERMTANVLREAVAETGVKDIGTVDLSDISDSLLDTSFSKYASRTKGFYTEDGYSALDYFLDEVTVASDEGKMLYLEDFVILDEPTAKDIEGAWEYSATLSNVESGFLDTVGSVVSLIIGKQNVDDALADFYNQEQNFSGYMNIKAIGDDTVEITIFGIAEESGEWEVNTQTGKIKKGMLIIDSGSPSANSGNLYSEENFEMSFYGYGEERYMSGSSEFVMEMFDITADVFYYGTRTSKDEFWDLEMIKEEE